MTLNIKKLSSESLTPEPIEEPDVPVREDISVSEVSESISAPDPGTSMDYNSKPRGRESKEVTHAPS